MGDQRTDFFRFYDFQPDVTRSNGRVEFDVGGSKQPYLATTGAPFVVFVVEAVGSDATWTVQEIDEDPRSSSDWRDLDSGTVSQSTRETIFVDRITARNVALHLDGDGHEARVYQTVFPLVSRLLAAGGDELVANALDGSIASSTIGLVTYLSRALGSIAQDVLRVDVVQQTLDALSVEAQEVDGRATVTGQSAETDVDLEDPSGSSITTTIDGSLYVDVRYIERLTIEVEPQINSGTDDLTANAYAKTIEETAERTLKTLSNISSKDFLVQAFDVSDVGWVRVTHDAAGSDHRFSLLGV